MKKHRQDGFLYQLHSHRELPDGCWVEVNGPWDKYGKVTSSKRQADGRYLNQIRGAAIPLLETVEYRF